MLYAQNALSELDLEMFRAPTSEYRGIPFWSWNCRVTRELIDEQLLIFQQMGFGGVDIHPRTGLEIEYLSEEYHELVAYAVQRCKELGMICWLYDDDRFPSGSAGGQVCRKMKYRGRFLFLTENKKEENHGYCENKEAFDRAVSDGLKPEGYYVTAYGLRFAKGRLCGQRRLLTEDDIEMARRNGERIRYAYVKLMEEEAWFEDQTYVDTMNPEATAEFIRLTYETYYDHVGMEFGHTVPAIFTDEPRLGKHAQISCAESGEDVALPYTEYLAVFLNERYGVDALELVPEYIWERADGAFSQNRYLYREACAECFVTAYMDQIADWCMEHQIRLTGHVLSEETLGSQTFALGDCMRCYRSMELPGIDILADRREFATAKQAVSVARQNGREGVVSELYGVTHWDCSFQTFKLQGDWQAALGITIRVPHLSHMSLGGEAKRDWPGSIFFQSPWYRRFSCVEDYFARLNTVLTRGKAVVHIGVVHPVESYWMLMGPDDQTASLRRERDHDFAQLIEWLLFGTLDFDFLSEALLPQQYRQASGQGECELTVGSMQYSVVLVPDLITIRSTTLDLLEAFAECGGKVIFMGRIPQLVDAQMSARAQRLAQKCSVIEKCKSSLYHVLNEVQEVEIYQENGQRAENLLCQLRQDTTCRWLFISQAYHGQKSSPEQYSVRVQGLWKITQYDAMTGKIYGQECKEEENVTVIPFECCTQGSLLLRLDPQEKKDGTRILRNNFCKQQKKVMWQTVQYLDFADFFRREEKNAVLLDYASWRLDGGALHEREEILRADNRIRKQLGFVTREERMPQPYHLADTETHLVELFFTVKSRVCAEVFLALEEVESSAVWLNGIQAGQTATEYYVDPAISVISLPKLQKGRNTLKIEIAYTQKTNLENMFLLGAFDVVLEGIVPVVEPERQSLTIGDITRQGMPFYTGNLEYLFRFSVSKDGIYAVYIPHAAAPLLSCCIDGGEEQIMLCAPYRAVLGKLTEGEHELSICLYGNRFNGFGTLHNANVDYLWYGPNSYRTTGEDWTDCYCLKPSGVLSAVEIQIQDEISDEEGIL